VRKAPEVEPAATYKQLKQMKSKEATVDRTAIIVCGLTSAEDARRLAELGVSYAGFIFYDKSPRFAEGKLDGGLIKATDSIKKVGVFVDAAPGYIRSQKEKYGLDLVQLHGDESPEDCRELRKEVPVIKAFRLKRAADLSRLQAYREVCDYFLFDTPGRLYGGNGTVFDWSLLEDYRLEVPFFLSGGIGPAQAEGLKAFAHPALHAIDINSRFETAPGRKNIDDIKRFLWDLNFS
jgi:phosphoribosylanthranilate isomerase